MKIGLLKNKLILIILLTLCSCNNSVDIRSDENVIIGEIKTFGRNTNKQNDYYFEIIIPDSLSGIKKYPRFMKDPIVFILFISLNNEIIRNTNVEKLMQGKINIDSYDEGGYLELKVLYGSENLVNKLMKLNKYEVASKKDEIIAEILRIHREYREEYNNYFQQEFKTKPTSITIYEKDYNYDRQTIKIEERYKNLSLKEASDFFNTGDGEIGNRQVYGTMVKKIKMKINDEPEFWSITNKRVKTLEEYIYNKDGKLIFDFNLQN